MFVLFYWNRTIAKHRRTLVISWAATILFLIVGAFLVRHADWEARQYWNSRLFYMAKNFAIAVENLRHEEIRAEADSQENPLYQRMLQVFERWQKQDEMIVNVCTFRVNEQGDFLYVVRPGADYNGDGKIEGELETFAPPGKIYPYTESEPLLYESIRFESPQFTEFPYYAGGLPWLYAVVPLFNKEKKIDAVLVIDYYTNLWSRHIKRARQLPVWGTMIVVLLTQVGTIFFITLRDSKKKVDDFHSRLEQSEINRKILDHSNDAIFLIQEKHFIYANRKACSLFAMTEEQFVEKTPFDLSPECQPDGNDSREIALAYMADAESGTPQSFKWTHRRSDGKPITLNITLEHVVFSEKTTLIVVAHDLTEERRAMAAESAFKMQRDFLDQLREQYRASLQQVIEASESLSRSDLTSKQREQIRSIEETSKSLCAALTKMPDSSNDAKV